MKKVLVFGMTSNPGGMESVIMNYYRNIDRSQIQFEFLCNSQEVAYEDEIKKLGGVIYKITARSRNPIKYEKEIHSFFKQNANKYSAAWINLCSLSNISYLKLAKQYGIKKRIVHCHNASNGGDSLLRDTLHKIHRKQISKYVTDCWTCSEEANEWFFGKEKNDLPNYRLIYNAIDLDVFSPNNQVRNIYRNKLNIKDDEILIGHVGRMHYQKNQEYLIKIMKKLENHLQKNYKLVMIGTGEDEKKIRNLVSEAHLNNQVIFQGVVSNTKDYLQAMDIYVFPSRFEGLSIALLEAQANGLPCIISDKISKASIVNDNVVMLPIDEEGIELWVEQIIKYSKVNKKVDIDHFKHQHFDIKEEAKILQELF